MRTPTRTRGSSESDLFHGYGRHQPERRTEDCACGGQITAESGWEAARVDEHNATPKHQAWRANVLASHQ